MNDAERSYQAYQALQEASQAMSYVLRSQRVQDSVRIWNWAVFNASLHVECVTR